MRQGSSHFALLVVLWLSSSTIAPAAETQLDLLRPLPYQVTQRTGVAPGEGYAEVVVRGGLPQSAEASAWEYRVVLLTNDAGRGREWVPLTARVDDRAFTASARVEAGGWYRLEVRCRLADASVTVWTVEPMGVGEVFVVAGQSYATNCNEELLNVKDPAGRVVAFNSENGKWAVASDPQPAPDHSTGGSIWPPLGDALVKELRVPVGFANVGVGATSSKQWLPEGQLHPRLVQAGQSLGRFRAVLWQQGESDVIAKTSTETYIANIETIRATAVRVWGFEPPWLLAKSTHHPTVYNDPEGEGRIRTAVDELLKRPGFRPGPDTDTLTGENRDAKRRRHFSAIGQRRAAEMWQTAIRREVIPPPAPRP